MKKSPLDDVFGTPAGGAEIVLDTFGGRMTGSEAIEAQERRGQADLNRSQMLPIDGTQKSQEVWERLGFIFGEPYDDLFVNVQFPQGWTMQPTDHNMWSNLLDAEGRLRGQIFYKAAFYDRSAQVSLRCRYQIIEPGYVIGAPAKVEVRDGDEVIYSVEHAVDAPTQLYPTLTELHKDAKIWLNETYPGWESIEAYW